MATKKTEKTAKAASKAKAAPKPKKAAAKPKAVRSAEPRKPPPPRHPKARVIAFHDSKAALAKSLAPALAREDEDEGQLADRLETASNRQLLRLQHVVETVKQKYGSRDKLIEAIGTAERKAKDKDYLAKLGTYSLPQLLDLAASHERRARA